MRTIIYECPVTGRLVQGIIPDGVEGPNVEWVPVDCPICRRPHIINIDPAPPPIDDKASAVFDAAMRGSQNS